MPIKIEPYLDEPIVLFTLSEPIDADTIQDLNNQAMQRLNQMGSYFAVFDITHLNTLVQDFIAAIGGHATAKSILSEPRIPHVFVSSSPSPDSVEGTFATVETALEHVRKQIATRNPDQPFGDLDEH